jgi:hypothetical protein
MREMEARRVCSRRLRVRFATAALGALLCVATIHCPADGTDVLDRQAARFVALALSLGNLRADEIDGYFGPLGLRASGRRDLASLRSELQQLRLDIDRSTDQSARMARLRAQVRAFDGLLQILDEPGKLTFDAEARLVYGIEPSPRNAQHSTEILRTLEKQLPGPGSLAARVSAFRARFVIPPDRRRAVFERALAECRARTRAKWRLPAEEKLNVEWTNDVDAAWHRYEGHDRSTLRLYPAAVAFVSAALDVACHEGYPGHHAQFVVMQAHARPGDLPVEDTVVLLRSPISMMREGAANYGVELAFPAAERLAFERNVLFPLAGLDPAQAVQYREVTRLVDDLSAMVVPLARDYRDKRLSAERARRGLESSALVSSPDALLRFVDRLGPYVLGYGVARDKVRSYVEAEHRRTGADDWTILRTVLEEGDVGLLGR